MKEKIYKKIIENIELQFLEVKNNSYLHKGHLGDNGTMETHFEIIVKSQELTNLGRLKAHQKINKILKSEFENGMHALEIKVL